ncbi:Ribosomal protein S12 methylthiotransferase RimO [Labeo rohita]|uniref:Ribosomal protein S12 methylthiotransferase RimO n=1 Tax=Labeo rohita TaxID=84645 RepID=A0ABQ8L4X6_LABRO|nr:Ribosomal protein S12 methylthiotransferase RimO [Labeo rohita]
MEGIGIGVEETELVGIAGGSCDKLDKGLSLSCSSAGDESELLDDDDVVSLTSFDPAVSALLGSVQEEQEMLDEEECIESESPQPSCPTYDELLEVMEHATARLDLPWKRVKKVAPRGRLDERFLYDHNLTAQVSLLFLPNLHMEVVKAWNKPFFLHIHRFQHTTPAGVADRVAGALAGVAKAVVGALDGVASADGSTHTT